MVWRIVKDLEFNKVFGIGLSRTGTYSLELALRNLGLKTVHFPDFMLGLRNGRLVFQYQLADEYTALTDTPIALFFRELDQHFPGSKFILTTRDKSEWLDSCRRHFSNEIKGNEVIEALHMALYGTKSFDQECFSKAFDRHRNMIAQYFENRPNDLLILDVDEPQKYKKIGEFLGLEYIGLEYPHANKRWTIWGKLNMRLKRLKGWLTDPTGGGAQ
jgi:hypothetical protein